MENVGINMNHISAKLLVNFVINVKRRTIFLQCVKTRKCMNCKKNDYDSDIYLDSVETDQNVKDWKVNLKIYDKTDNMKLDAGAQCKYCHIMSIKRLAISHLKHQNQDKYHTQVID